MKLSTSIFALVATSAVYARSINSEMNFLKKREMIFDNNMYQEQQEQLVSKACNAELEKYDECMSLDKFENYNETCPIFKSDKCQKFYNDIISFAPTCKNSDIVIKILSPLMKHVIPQSKFLCQNDEAGKHCPISDLFVKTYYGTYDPSDDEIKKAKEKTCHSKICREVTYEFYSKSAELAQTFYDILGTDAEKILEKYTRLSKYYDSTECKALSSNTDNSIQNNDENKVMSSGIENVIQDNKQPIKNQNNDENKVMTSSASTLNIGSGLLISLGLLLISLY